MVDRKVTDDTAILGAAVASSDLFDLVDVSDTTDAVTGTNKKITAAETALAIISLGSIATDAEVSSAISALSATYQPLDSDLTAIAALATTAFGRGLLILADASATRTALSLVPGTDVEVHDADLTTIAGLTPTNDDVLQRKAGAWTNRTIAQLLTDLGIAASYQPLDSDLTAIAALTTTATGRSLLAAADAAALRTILALGTVATQASSELVQAANGGKETLSTNATATGAVTVNLANGNVFKHTLTGNVTYTFSGSTASVACSFTLDVTQDGTGSRTITFPASVKWAAATAPTISTGASKRDAFAFYTLDNGTTWVGSTVGIDIR